MEKESTKEQILGLYIVGLLAVLLTIKLSAKLDAVTDSYLGIVIMLWGVYSFFMVFAYSNIPRLFESSLSKNTYEQFASLLKDAAQVFLIISFGASILFFIWFMWVPLFLVLFLLVIILPFYYLGRSLWRRSKKKRKSPTSIIPVQPAF